MPWLVAQRLTGVSQGLEAEQLERSPQSLTIRGTEGAVVTFGRCCHPIPGDPIVGFASSGRGVVVHHQDCRNIREYRNHPEKWLDVQWDEGVEGEFPAAITVDVVNKRGVLADVAATVADMESNIENVSLDEREGMIATIRLVVAVRDRVHLARVIRGLRVLSVVLRIMRLRG